MLSTGQTGRVTRSSPRLRTRKGPYLVDQTKLGAIQARADASGGLVYSPWGDQHGRAAWLVNGKGKQACTSPVLVVLNSGEGEATPHGSAIELHTRCRKCEACRKAKTAFWKLRAMAEIGRSARTWFVTLTWRPEDRIRAEYAMEEPNATGEERFRALLKAVSPAVNLWLQRMRKGLRTEGETSVSFRYLLVWEAHTDGFPHAHLLIHEQEGQVLTKRRIQREWKSGFSNCRLVASADPDDLHKSAAYTCKYIAKTMLVRVRASFSYGASAASAS